ncbi:MAG: hypothetical protein ACR2RL_03215 [Gammaproteobacteria bacterium]
MRTRNPNGPARVFKSTALALAIAAAGVIPQPAEAAGLECSLERCTLAVNDRLSFEVDARGALDVDYGIELSGDVTMHAPGLSVALLDSTLIFEPTPEGADMAFELYGTARAPFPALPLFKDATFHAEPMAAVGLVSRHTLKQLMEDDEAGYTLPLAENPKDEQGDPDDLIEPAYLFFHFESGLALDLPLGKWLQLNQDEDAHNPFDFSVPGDKSATFVLDPAEPYFFLSQDAREFASDKLEQARALAAEANEQRQRESEPAQASDNNAAQQDRPDANDGEDGGSLLPDLGEIAFSTFGGIPFEPQMDWGLPRDVGYFKGHLHIDTTIPLFKFVEINGAVVTRIDEHGFEQAGNGDVQVTFDLIPGLLNFNFPLGNATAGIKLTDEELMTYFSGLNHPDYSFVPSFIPMVPSNTTIVAGYISSDRPQDTQIHAEGQFGYDMSGLRELTGIDLSNLAVSTARLDVDVNGARLQGRTSSSIHPSIDLGGQISVDIYFPFRNPADARVQLRGDMQVAGIGLTPVMITVDKTGLHVRGDFVTPISLIRMTGDITSAGPSLAGRASVTFALNAIADAINAARADVIKAAAEVTRLQLIVDQNRRIVRADRDRDAANLQKARQDVANARNKVAGIQSSINYHHSRIRSYNSAISAKYRWYKRQKWYNKPWAWGVYVGYRAGKSAQIGAAYAAIAGLETAKATAQSALRIAEAVLYATEQAMDLTPIDLDPRVAGPLAAKEIALAALKVAEAALPPLPVINADVRGVIDARLDAGGLKGALKLEAGSLAIADGYVEFGLKPRACISLANLGDICTPF